MYVLVYLIHSISSYIFVQDFQFGGSTSVCYQIIFLDIYLFRVLVRMVIELSVCYFCICVWFTCMEGLSISREKVKPFFWDHVYDWLIVEWIKCEASCMFLLPKSRKMQKSSAKWHFAVVATGYNRLGDMSATNCTPHEIISKLKKYFGHKFAPHM